MSMLRQTVKPVSVIVIISMLFVVVPYQSCLAALIGTETVIETARGHEAREHVKQILDRQEIRKALRAQGVSAEEAKARVDALSDAEAVRLAQKLDQLPAGGSALGVVIGAALVVFIVLLITDILGYTDVFTFVKKRHVR
jgi:CHASE3 domain sensor protein